MDGVRQLQVLLIPLLGSVTDMVHSIMVQMDSTRWWHYNIEMGPSHKAISTQSINELPIYTHTHMVIYHLYDADQAQFVVVGSV